jgi:hypothetical protein
MAVGAILVVGFAVAVLLPNGRYCDGGVDRFRQWSYTNEGWSYGCGPGSNMPADAKVDSRIPLRIGVGATLLLAFGVGRLLNLRGAVRPARAGEKQRLSTMLPRNWMLIAIYGLLGAALALVLTFRHDSHCSLRGPGSLSCPYKSFLGWDTTPVLVDVLWAVVGAAAGTALALVIARLGRANTSRLPFRLPEASRTLRDDRS